MSEFDSRPDTLLHIRRVGELLARPITELVERIAKHDASKLQDPERAMFDEFTPRLRDSTFGSAEYKGFLRDMGPALLHHYEHNRHHPEHHPDGVTGMTLVDLIEMLADWRAATERHADGDLRRSIGINAERFGVEPQLLAVILNTAEQYGWV